MRGLLAALLATTLASGSDDAVMQRLHVRIDAKDVVARSCRDAARNPEPGLATFNFRYRLGDGRWLGPHRYTATLVFSIEDVVIHIPRTFAWPGMSDDDRYRAELLRRAIVHHEIGHVRIAEGVRDELNAQEPIVAPDVFAFGAAADARGRDGFALFTQNQRAYDERTEHGRRQHLAGGVLAGPDTVILCE